MAIVGKYDSSPRRPHPPGIYSVQMVGCSLTPPGMPRSLYPRGSGGTVQLAVPFVVGCVGRREAVKDGVPSPWVSSKALSRC